VPIRTREASSRKVTSRTRCRAPTRPVALRRFGESRGVGLSRGEAGDGDGEGAPGALTARNFPQDDGRLSSGPDEVGQERGGVFLPDEVERVVEQVFLFEFGGSRIG
jgi:hypothetical protein